MQNLFGLKVSGHSLKTILERVGELPDDVSTSKRALYASRSAALQEVSRTVTFDTHDGHQMQIEMADPNLLLTSLLHDSVDLRRLYKQAWQKRPCSAESPWSLVVGFDEYVPGNKLALQQRRKTMVLSYNYLEVGDDALSRDSCWLTPLVVRTSVISQTKGGWSAILRHYLKLHLLGDSGASTAGVPIVLDEGEPPRLLFAKLAFVISDGDGLRQALEWKGAAGIKPCFRHYNVFAKGSDLAHRGQGFVEIDCACAASFAKWRQQDLDDMVDASIELARRDAPKSRVESFQTICGFSCTPAGLLADQDLRRAFDAIDVFRYDWVHSALADGLLNVEIWQFLSKRDERKRGIMRDVQKHMRADWKWPAHGMMTRAILTAAFSNSAINAFQAADKFKAAASNLIFLYSLIRNFVDENQAAILELGLHAEHQSFLAACKIIDLLMSVKHRRVALKTGSVLLRRALERHATLHQSAYNNAFWKPKHHWLFDVAEAMGSDPFLFDSLVIERLHLRCKAAAERVCTLQNFEGAVLAEMLNSQRQMLGAGVLRDGLVKPSKVGGYLRNLNGSACVFMLCCVDASRRSHRDYVDGRFACREAHASGRLYYHSWRCRPVWRQRWNCAILLSDRWRFAGLCQHPQLR